MAKIRINSGGSKKTGINKAGKPSTVRVNDHDYKSFAFDAVDDSISIPQTTMNYAYNASKSYEHWFKANSLAGVEKTLFSMFNASGFGTKAYISNTNYINYTVRQGTPRILVRAEYAGSKPYIDQVLVTNMWCQLIITDDGTGANGVNFYINKKLLGKVVQTNTLNVNPANTSSIWFGAGVGGTGNRFNGEMSLFRSFSKVLSQSEIDTLYNNGQPLINTSISNLEFDFIPDIVAKDRVNNVTGTISGAILKSCDVNALIRNRNQKFTGGKLYYNTYGLAGEANADTVIDSPFTDPRPCILWHSDNKSDIGWQQRPYLPGSRQGMLFTVDHAGKFATPSYPIGYESPGGFDNHGAPSVTDNAAGDTLPLSEDQHDTPLYVRRAIGRNIKNVQALSIVPNNQSYPAPSRIGNDIFVFSRGSGANRDIITKSTDGGATWGTSYQVVQSETSLPNLHRLYFRNIYHPTKLIYFILLREEISGLFSKIYYIESTDGVTFRNINNTFSKNIVSSGTITRSELDNNCYVLGAIGGTDVWLKCAMWTSAGICGYTNHATNNYQFFYHNGSSWVTKPLPLPLYTPTQAGGNEGRIDAWGPYSYNLDSHIIHRIEPRNGYNVIVRYASANRWDSWDAGTVISDTNKNHDQLQFTHNINDAAKVLVAAGQLTGNATFDNNIFLYEFTP